MAKKFKFKLEAMLKYRQILEDEKKREFAQANAAVAEKHRQAEAIAGERLVAIETARSMTEKGEFNMQYLTDTLRYAGNLEMNAAAVRREEEQLRKQTEGLRQAFVAARRDKRVVEIIREKRLTAYRYEVDRQNQLELEEVALRVLGRKK